MEESPVLPPPPWGGQGEGVGRGGLDAVGRGQMRQTVWGEGQMVRNVPPWWCSLEDVGVSLLGGQALRPGVCLRSERNAAATKRPFSGQLRGGFPCPGCREGAGHGRGPDQPGRHGAFRSLVPGAALGPRLCLSLPSVHTSNPSVSQSWIS